MGVIKRDIINKVVIKLGDRTDSVVLDCVDGVSYTPTELHVQQYTCLKTSVYLCDVDYVLLYRGCGVVILYPNKKYVGINTTYFESEEDLDYKIEKFIRGVSI